MNNEEYDYLGSTASVQVQPIILPCKREIPEPKSNEMAPVFFPQANGMLHGNRAINDLPVCSTDGNLVSCWRIPLWKRVKLLFTGRIWLVVKGTTQPPLWIDTEVVWK